MNLPLKIAFKDMTPSDAVATVIKERVARLQRHFKELNSCRVIVQEPHRSHQQGRLFHVTIDVTVPGRELAVGRGPAEAHSHQNVYVAIRDAFHAIERQLDAWRDQRRRYVKTHAPKPQARIVRLFPNEGCGFLQTDDGREIYFHVNSVVNDDFEQLRLGTVVRFDEEQGNDGPQASTVEVVRRAS